MKTKLSVLLIMISTLASFAQGEANNWYFGQNAAITFNSGTPVAITNSAMQTFEGCATLSDSIGQLLFYTDGKTIYNSNHQVMLNGSGLLGHESSTQSGTIVPLPGSTNLFYVFTLDEVAKPNGFRYSIIDLNLDGGLGAVTTTKNVLVYTPSCEKISVVKHSNNIDYWILTHAFESNNFYCHLLSSSGLSSSPVVSGIGFAPFTASNGVNKNGAPGGMKISPNGQKLAVCYSKSLTSDENFLELYDFNNNTGVVSNVVTLLQTTSNTIYGVEFSPNNQILYATANNSFFLYQFDLTASDIPNSIVTIFQNPSSSPNQFRPLSLQLGPDGKIYSAMGSNPFLGCINNPNVLGSGCSFVPNQVDLLGRNSSLGLPVFNQSYFSPAIQLQNACVGEFTQFQISNSAIVSAIWNFGDGTTSNNINPIHSYTMAGTYTVSVTATTTYGTGVTTRDITISEVPIATQPSDILICDNNNDGVFSFNLATKSSEILNGQSTAQYGVRYYANAIDYASNITIANPNNYANTTAYQLQTIIAEVYNLNNLDCKAITTFNIQVFESPTPNLTISPIKLCDSISFGTDSDGKVVFNLTGRQTEILNGQLPANFTLAYYKDAGFIDLISNPSNYVNTDATETIFVKITNNQNATCFGTTSFEIEVFSLPIINANISLKQCDDNNDGFSDFNLSEANEFVATSTTGLSFSYFETFTDAQNNTNPISNFTIYSNQTVSTDQVYIRVENANECVRVASLNLIVSTTLIPVSFQRYFTKCDDTISGSNTDGIATFDFSNVTNEIEALYPSGQLLDITFYKNIIDALAEVNAISNTSNYSNTGYPNTQNIYVRVDSQLNNECLGLGHHITLNVDPIPVVQPLVVRRCDDDQDGLYQFDTINLQANLLNGLTNVSVSYTDLNGMPIVMTNPYLTNSQTINATVSNTFGEQCDFTTTIQFIVEDLPEAFPIDATLTTACDDEADPMLQNGIYPFDTSSFQSTILGSQTGLIVKYYDAFGNLLSTPLPNPFLSASQTLLVEVSNSINTNCIATNTIPLVVNERPKINLIGSELVCSDDLSFTKIINAGLSNPSEIGNYSYTWYLNGTVLAGETNYTLTVNTAGTYSVAVENANGCVTTRTISVTSSNTATIDAVEINDLVNNNSILILVSGDGNYTYSIDGQNYQNNNFFDNLLPGIYTVYVNDELGCGITTQQISVLGIPKFFTPNNDGTNDYWNIDGVNQQFNANAIIRIYDRFGKLLKQIKPLSVGWDGTYNSQIMISDDYWYTVELENGRIAKGHFTLKR